MSPGAKMEYLESIYLRYKKASRKEKSKILDEFCQNCPYHRKHAIRLLTTFSRFHPKPRNKRGRKSIYNPPALFQVIKRIWLAANQPCGKRLKPTLLIWLASYQIEYGILSSKIIAALTAISCATLDRLLTPIRIKYNKRGRSTTKPGTLLKKHIPIKLNQWDESSPGFLEADTVAHCGDSLEGMFAYTLDAVDIATSWTEQRAVWGKGEAGVLKQLKSIENSLPFPLLGFDSDNGSEFLNYHLLRHFTKRKTPVQFTRSRPYHKDDNAHIEQKNWTHVRQWLGYHRLDNPKVVALMNDLYTTEWRLYHNFFLPSVKLIEKKRIASQIVKKHDTPKTPYQRVLEHTMISQETKDALKEQFALLNPFDLKRKMEAKLAKIFNLVYKV